jgi:hypothetical protein
VRGERRVLKYHFRPGVNDYRWPPGARPVFVHAQHGRLCMWVDMPIAVVEGEDRRFIVVATGDRLDADVTYVGTALLADGALVLHVFEVPG